MVFYKWLVLRIRIAYTVIVTLILTGTVLTITLSTMLGDRNRKIELLEKIVQAQEYELYGRNQYIEHLEKRLGELETVIKIRTDTEALVNEVARAYSLPVGFIMAIMTKEDADVEEIGPVNRNGSYDRGVMQLNNFVFPTPHWYTPEVNVNLACFFINDLALRFNYDWRKVATAYNCGPGPVVAKKPPKQSIKYADHVMELWRNYDMDEYYAKGGT